MNNEPVNLIKSYEGRFKKSLGQNFLVSKYYLDKVASYLPSGKDMVEIGVGFGCLTRELLSRGNRVVGFEIDEGIYSVIKKELQHPDLDLINDDARKYSKYINKKITYDVISALPYSTYKDILLSLSRSVQRFNSFYLIVQQDVYDKLSATSGGQLRPISVICNYLFDIKKLVKLPPSAFYPRPHVYSVMFEMKKLKGRQIDVDHVYNKLTALFINRRKKLKGTEKRVDEFGIEELLSVVSGQN